MRQQFWVPGRGIELHDEYPVPSAEALQAKWQAYLGEGIKIIAAPGVYGAVRVPEDTPRVYASVDVCEVLRETHLSMRKVEEPEPKPVQNIHAYADGLSFANSKDITSVLQVMMTNALVEPVTGIEEIASIVREWRKQGAYVIANTSTLPGCENGTIEFFDEYLPDCFDGILLPRNHDGSLPLTKGIAGKNVVELFSPGERVTAIHIDDSQHHNVSFRNEVGALSDSIVATFLPEYPTHYPIDEGSVVAPTPLAAFEFADRFLAPYLV